MTSVSVVGTGATLTLDTLDSDEVVRENLATNGNMVAAGGNLAIATNAVVNPSFEGGISSWTVNNCTASVTASFPQMLKAGGSIVQCVSDGTATVPGLSMISASYRPAVNPGQWVGFTAFLATEIGYEVRVQIAWRDSTGTNIAFVASPYVTGSFYTGANPQIVAQAPANTVSVAYYLQYRDPANPGVVVPSGKRMWADACKLVVRDTQEEAQYWTDFQYWDGATGVTDFTTAWTGTAHLSTSTIASNTPSNVSGSIGTGGVVYLNNATAGGPKEGTHYARMTWMKGSAGGSAGIIYTQQQAGSAGDSMSVRVSLRTSSSAKDVALLFRYRNISTTVTQNALAYVRLVPGQWTDFVYEGLVAGGAYTNLQVYALISNSNVQATGETLDMDCVLLEQKPTIAPQYYDGNTPNSDSVDYIWMGTPNASISRAIYHVTDPGYPVANDNDPSNLPPRIRVTVSGVTGTKTYQLTRSAGGDTNIVPGWVSRSITGSDVDIDWAAPLNRVIRYQLIDSVAGVVATANIVLDSNAAILQDPILPDKFIRVSARGARIPDWATMTEGSTSQLQYGNGANLVPIMGSMYPVALGGQATRGTNVPELFSTYSENSADTFRNMVLGGANVFLLRTTQDMKPLPALAYLSGAFSENPITSMWDKANGTTHWEINANLVAAVMQAAKSGYITYDQVQALLGGLTYDQVQAKYASLKYLDVQASPLIYQAL